MSKAGLTLLLPLVLLLVSGETNKTFAHEKLTTISLNGPKKETVCSPLQNFLITSAPQCEMKIISQRELVAKLEPKNTNTISYFTEPTYFVPTPTAITEIQPISTPTVIPSVSQTPVSMLGPNGQNNNSEVIFEMINAHRAKIGKPSRNGSEGRS